MDSVGPHSNPSDIAAEQGLVILEGPNGLALTMTANAAEETGRRLLAAAKEARGQAAGTETA